MSQDDLPTARERAVAHFGDDLVRAASHLDAHLGTYTPTPLGQIFDDDADFRRRLQAGDATADRALLALLQASDHRADTAAFACAIVAAAPVVDEHLVVDALRYLTVQDDAACLRAALPLLHRTWSGAMISVAACPVPQKAAIIADYLRAHPPYFAPTPHTWADADGPAPNHGALLADCYADASPDERRALIDVGTWLFAHASTTSACTHLASRLAAMGQLDPCERLQDAESRTWQPDGMRIGLAHDARRTLSRHALALRDQTATGRALQAALDDASMIAACRADAYLAVLFVGGFTDDAPYEGGPSTLAYMHLSDGTWSADATLEATICPGPSLSVPSAFANRGVLQLRGETTDRDDIRWYLVPRDGRVLWSSNQAGLKTLLKGADQSQRVRKRSEPVREPVRVPDAPSIPVGLHVRATGRAASRTSGKVVVPGDTHVGVYDGDELQFAPPDAVAIGLGDGRLVSWRVCQKAGTTGVSRSDHDWVVEVFTWNRDTPAHAVFERCHVIQSRDIIAWCWPDTLRFPKSRRHRLVTLVARSEDDKRELHIVVHDDGTFSETEHRATAIALARKHPKPIDASCAVAHRTAPSVRPPSGPPR